MNTIERFVRLAKILLGELRIMLYKNLGWKLFSLIIAICLWFVVINTTNPKEVWLFPMKLTLADVEAFTEKHNVVVKNQKTLEGTTITVKVRGNRLALEALNKNKSQMTAAANLGVIYDFTLNGDVLAPIVINFPVLDGLSSDAFEVVYKSPEFANITLEEIVTEEKAVKVTITGDVKEGYVALAPEINPPVVMLTGPKSKLQQIDAVSVETKLHSDTSDMKVLAQPKLLDRDSKEVEGVSCETSLVEVLIKINKYKKVPVYATYVGVPEEGYTITDVEWDPKDVEIVGSDDAVEEFKEIRLTAVNVSGLRETNATSFDIRTLEILPESVSIKNGTPNNVAVTVYIEKIIEKQINLTLSSVSTGTISSTYSYNVAGAQGGAGGTFPITIRGGETVINSLNAGKITSSVNVDGLGVGEHLLPLIINLPKGVSLAGDAPIVTVGVTTAPIVIPNVGGVGSAVSEPAANSPPETTGEADVVQIDN